MKKLLALAASGAVLAAAAVPALAATKTVKVNDNVFQPSTLTVSKGTTVKWRWVGTAMHNVSVTSGPVKFRSNLQRSGTFSKRLKKAGTYRIVCTVHPGMNMKLRVR